MSAFRTRRLMIRFCTRETACARVAPLLPLLIMIARNEYGTGPNTGIRHYVVQRAKKWRALIFGGQRSQRYAHEATRSGDVRGTTVLRGRSVEVAGLSLT